MERGKPAGCTGFILVGGESKRLGLPKATLAFRGATLLERVVAAVAPVCRDVVIVGTPRVRTPVQLPCGTRAIPDYPGKAGPLAGIAAGLAWLPAGGAGIFVACDLPFLNTCVVSRIASHLADHVAVVPRWDGFIEPLVAGYSAPLLGPVLAALDRGDREVRSFLPDIGVFYLEGDSLSSCGDPRRLFFNINTMDDYHRALSIEETLERGTDPPGRQTGLPQHVIRLPAGRRPNGGS